MIAEDEFTILTKLRSGWTLWRSPRSGSYYLQSGLPSHGGASMRVRARQIRAMLRDGTLVPSTDQTTQAPTLIPNRVP